jgi:hypothetical protein
MRRTTLALSVAALALMAPMAVSITGCTALGYTLGQAWDRQHSALDKETDPSLLAQLKPGDPCALVLADSTVIRGEYMGLMPRVPGEDVRTPRRIRMGTFGDAKKLDWNDMRLAKRGISTLGGEPTGSQVVNAGDVRVVLLPGSRSGQHVGTLVGFTADAVILISLMHHRSAPEPPPSGCDDTKILQGFSFAQHGL